MEAPTDYTSTLAYVNRGARYLGVQTFERREIDAEQVYADPVVAARLDHIRAVLRDWQRLPRPPYGSIVGMRALCRAFERLDARAARQS